MVLIGEEAPAITYSAGGHFPDFIVRNLKVSTEFRIDNSRTDIINACKADIIIADLNTIEELVSVFWKHPSLVGITHYKICLVE